MNLKRYRIKNKKKGYLHTIFSNHAQQRIKEREVDFLDILYSLCLVSEDLCIYYDNVKRVVVANEEKNISIILKVNRSSYGSYYFNIITILNFIPRAEEGQPAFYYIADFITI